MSKYLSQLKTFAFTDILGWSNSRHDTFQSCKRRYYYTYYSKYDFKNVSKIYVLRNLTSVPLEIGNITHKLLETMLRRFQKTFEPIDHEKLFSFAQRQVHDICRTKTFEDIYYGKRTEIDFDEEIVKPVCTALLNFLQSDRMQWIYEEALINKDDWIIELQGDHRYGECRIDSLKAYCKVDFMFPIGDGEIHILDWKTGKEHYGKHSTQLRGYAGWARCMFGLEFEKINLTIAYMLPEYRENSVQVNEYDLDNFANTVREESQEMYKYCADHHANIPLPKESFPMTEAVNFCKTCNFRELCDRV